MSVLYGVRLRIDSCSTRCLCCLGKLRSYLFNLTVDHRTKIDMRWNCRSSRGRDNVSGATLHRNAFVAHRFSVTSRGHMDKALCKFCGLWIVAGRSMPSDYSICVVDSRDISGFNFAMVHTLPFCQQVVVSFNNAFGP